MDTALDSLHYSFRPLAIALLARAVEARIPLIIINTRRSAAEQAACLASGHSWVSHSLHQDGLAIDVAPLASYLLHGGSKVEWNPDPVWARLGDIGSKLGLRWGGGWTVPDLGHFELIPSEGASFIESKLTT